MNNGYSDIIRSIRKKLLKIYSTAEEDLRDCVYSILSRFEGKIKELEKKVESREITKEAAKTQLFILFSTSKIPEIRKMAETLYGANAESLQEIRKKVPKVISDSLSRESYEIETELGADIGMVPVSEEEMREWMDDDEDLFDPGDVDEERDEEWNDKSIRKFIQTGVLLGLGTEALARYIVSGVTGRNRESMMRKLFDIISGANEEGRQIAMTTATGHGAEIEKQWVATLDFKTRDAHRQLDGKRVPVDEPFYVDGEEIRFPRDPQAPAYLRCNCRCAIRRTRAKWADSGYRRENIRDEDGVKPVIPWTSYEEWYKMKQQELGQEEIDRIIKEMKREQARKAYRKRKKKKQGGG